MNVLVVYAHPNPKSFNQAILEEFTKGLKNGGHNFEVDDLHASKFDPVLKTQDLAQFTGGQMPPDVLAEQEKIKGADALVFIYPVCWWGFPAMLKGWFDRVMSYGFAYQFTPAKGPEGLLRKKRVLLINTTLAGEDGYKALGAKDAMTKIIDDLRIKWCGMSNVEHVFLYSPARVGAGTRNKYLEKAYRLGKEF